MMRHILKLLWNRKKNYRGIFVEQALIMLVLMVCLVGIFDMVKKYKTPGLLDVDNTILCGWNTIKGDLTPEEMADIYRNYESIAGNLKQLPHVLSLTKSHYLAPYFGTDMHMPVDSVVIENRRIDVFVKGSDEYGLSVFRPVLEEGEWLTNKKRDDGTDPVVITRQLAEKAGWSSAVGKKLILGSQTFTVVGVVAGLKQQPFDPSPPAVVIPVYLSHPSKIQYVVRLKGNEKDAFFLSFYNETKRQLSLDRVEPVIIDMETLRTAPVFTKTIWWVLLGVSIAFFTFFAFIGTFGLFWLYAQKHFAEYALRMALGSTRKQLIYTVIAESLLLTCLAVLPSLILFFLVYTSGQLVGFAVAAGIMVLFSVVSAWFPAWSVSRVKPAEALQYE
ncbi:MAG: ABC transporter permease [Prevotellaceae bacterium]|nr:ABC transporter permease [Prevotellaceae bacterium]